MGAAVGMPEGRTIRGIRMVRRKAFVERKAWRATARSTLIRRISSRSRPVEGGPCAGRVEGWLAGGLMAAATVFPASVMSEGQCRGSG